MERQSRSKIYLKKEKKEKKRKNQSKVREEDRYIFWF